MQKSYEFVGISWYSTPLDEKMSTLCVVFVKSGYLQHLEASPPKAASAQKTAEPEANQKIHQFLFPGSKKQRKLIEKDKEKSAKIVIPISPY